MQIIKQTDVSTMTYFMFDVVEGFFVWVIVVISSYPVHATGLELNLFLNQY